MKSIASIALLGILSLSTVLANGPMQRFDGFQMYNIKVDTPAQQEQFNKLGNNIPLSFVNEIGGLRHSYDVLVDPENQIKFEELLDFNEFVYEVKIPDLQKVIEDARLADVLNPVMSWTQYHQLETINNWVDSLAEQYPSIVKVYDIGKSYENRTIKALKISHKLGNKAIFIESGIHAVEWIASAAGTFFINELLTSQDERIRHLAFNYDWIYVPVLNPDGFHYSHNVHPLWRKNRKPTGFSNSSGICYGTDLNRNFDAHWGVNGWNLDVPCDHWYQGSQANSEPEVQALQKFVNKFLKKDRDYIRIYLALHSYGNLVVLPYGFTNEVSPPNFNQMLRMSKSFADSAEANHGTEFLYGSSGTLLYFVSGGAKDWAYEKKGIPYTATIEFRDNTHGFFLPADQIKEVGEEFTEGVIGLVGSAVDEQFFNPELTNCQLKSLID